MASLLSHKSELTLLIRTKLSMSVMAQFGVLKTSELRDLLEDEEKINQIIKCSQKFQELKRATENMLVSNCTLAEANLSQKPAFTDAKLLLAMKYEELNKLISIIQAKQVQLEEEEEEEKKYTTGTAKLSLLKKTACDEKESEMLFQRFVEGKTAVADFLVGFQNARKFYHIRQVLLKKIQEVTELKDKPHRPVEILPSNQNFLTTDGLLHYAYHPFCRPAVILPPISYPFTPLPLHPSFLMPFGASVPFGHRLHSLPFRFDYLEPVYSRLYGEVSRGPTRPVRLQKLQLQPRKHHRQTPR